MIPLLGFIAGLFEKDEDRTQEEVTGLDIHQETFFPPGDLPTEVPGEPTFLPGGIPDIHQTEFFRRGPGELTQPEFLPPERTFETQIPELFTEAITKEVIPIPESEFLGIEPIAVVAELQAERTAIAIEGASISGPTKQLMADLDRRILDAETRIGYLEDRAARYAPDSPTPNSRLFADANRELTRLNIRLAQHKLQREALV